MKPNNYQLITNGNMTLTLTSPSYLIENSLGFAIQAVYSGSPVGTLQINGSCDPGGANGGVAYPGTVTNWTPLSGGSVSINAAGNSLINVQEPFYRWIQVVYTPSSGSGTLNVQMNSKSI